MKTTVIKNDDKKIYIKKTEKRNYKMVAFLILGNNFYSTFL